uniref:Uncharacterized protein n=1 Tax=Romanomermis culicivorax TaxID=13658 RepID=A0A915HKM5_ROMCU
MPPPDVLPPPSNRFSINQPRIEQHPYMRRLQIEDHRLQIEDQVEDQINILVDEFKSRFLGQNHSWGLPMEVCCAARAVRLRYNFGEQMPCIPMEMAIWCYYYRCYNANLRALECRAWENGTLQTVPRCRNQPPPTDQNMPSTSSHCPARRGLC